MIELFSHEIRQPDQELLNMLATIGSQIGQFIERKRAEAELRESEQNYRMLFESIDEGFCTIEVLFDQNEKPVDYRFLQIIPSFGRQTGIRNAAGKRMREIAPQHEEHWFEIYGRIALTGEPMRFEMKPNNSDAGMTFTPSGSKTPSADASESFSTTSPSASGRKPKHETASAAIAKCRRSLRTRTVLRRWDSSRRQLLMKSISRSPLQRLTRKRHCAG